MKYIQFTKKENEVMDILWKHDIAMSREFDTPFHN